MFETALGISQLATFILVADIYRLENFPLSLIAHSHLGMSNDLSRLNHRGTHPTLARSLVVPKLVELGHIYGHEYRYSIHWGRRKSR